MALQRSLIFGIGIWESARRSWLPDLTTTAAYCGRCRFTTSLAADLRHYARRHGRDGLATAGDNGASFKATTVMAMLHWLGIEPSSSRPRVSDDNAFVESLFRTAKYLSSRVPEHRLCQPGGGAPLGGSLRAVVQPPPSP
ncbi:transposase [Xanthomonas vasicola]|nr:transposase [Xanthomonas vasicola]